MMEATEPDTLLGCAHETAHGVYTTFGYDPEGNETTTGKEREESSDSIGLYREGDVPTTRRKEDSSDSDGLYRNGDGEGTTTTGQMRQRGLPKRPTTRRPPPFVRTTPNIPSSFTTPSKGNDIQQVEKRTSRNWVVVVLSLLFLGAIGGGFYFFWEHRNGQSEISRLKEVRDENVKEIESLKSQNKHYADHFREIESIENEMTGLKQTLKKLKEDHSKKIHDLSEKHKAEIAQENEKREKEVQDLHTNHQQNLAHVSQQNANEIEELKSDHKKEIVSLNEKHNEEISLNNQRREEELQKLKEINLGHQNSLTAYWKQHADEIGELKNKHTNEIKSLEVTHGQNIASIKKSWESKLEETKTEWTHKHEEELTRLKNEHQQYLTKLESEHDKARTYVLHDHKNVIGALEIKHKTKIDSIAVQNEKNIASVNESWRSLNQEHEMLHVEHVEKLKNEYESRIARLQEENNDLSMKRDILNNEELQRLKNKLSEVEKQRNEAKEDSQQRNLLEKEINELKDNMKREEVKLKEQMREYFTTFIVNPENAKTEARKLYLQLQKWISQEFKLPGIKENLVNAAENSARKAGWLNEPWAKDFLEKWVV